MQEVSLPGAYEVGNSPSGSCWESIGEVHPVKPVVERREDYHIDAAHRAVGSVLAQQLAPRVVLTHQQLIPSDEFRIEGRTGVRPRLPIIINESCW